MATQAPTKVSTLTRKASNRSGDNAPPISLESQRSLIQYADSCFYFMNNNYNMRHRMQEIDRQYQREMDYTATHQRAIAANKAGKSTAMQNVTIPVVMPQVESALTELSNIFLTSYPLFPVFSKPEMQDAAMMMETTIGEQGVKFGWAAELLQCLRDGLKYNIMAAEVVWEDKRVWSVGNDATQSVKHGVATESIYSGNAIKRIDPYNIIIDSRVLPWEVHTKGEFVGKTEMISRIALKQELSEMDPTKTMNAKEAFESGLGSFSTSAMGNEFFIPQINPNALIDHNNIGYGQSMNWLAWGGFEKAGGIRYSDIYEKTTLYCKILPAEHRIHGRAGNTPQIYKLIIINRKVIIFCERQSNAHNMLPIIVAQALEDGTGWQAKSFADNAVPYQQLATALWNSGLESQRRKVFDRIFYDPSRINKADIDNTSTVARIPIKNEAYGKPVQEAVYAFPYRDENVPQIFNAAEQVIQMADIANGQNRVQRGQFQKGNKTRQEFDTVMDKSVARPHMIALVIENRFFTPLKDILKFNTLQFQPPTTGYNRNEKMDVKIDPVLLREQAMEFKVADGLLPTSEYMNTELFQTILQIVATYPMILQQWDIIGMIFYWLKLEGATWINDFKLAGAGTAPPMQQPGAAPGTPATGAPVPA